MAIGYNVVQPNGLVKKQRVQNEDERCEAVTSLLQRWEEYCNRNWISVNYGDPFCSENKVKLFLNGLAYFLLLGNTGDIVTDYKRVMDGKREIPISSCPSSIEDMVYGTGATLASTDMEGCTYFSAMLEQLDEKAEKIKPSRKKSFSQKYNKLDHIRNVLGKCECYFPIVDTENKFTLLGKRYRIDPTIHVYNGKIVGDDVLYDMDKILCMVKPSGEVYFFDMNMDLIPNEFIHSVD